MLQYSSGWQISCSLEASSWLLWLCEAIYSLQLPKCAVCASQSVLHRLPVVVLLPPFAGLLLSLSRRYVMVLTKPPLTCRCALA